MTDPRDEPIDVTPTRVAPRADVDPQRLASLRQLTFVIYLLYALSWFVGITALVAIIINYVKREDVAGTLYESHFTWQIRTFWWGLLWAVLGGLTLVFGVGLIVLGAAFVWTLYRLVKGFLYWNDRRPLPV
ncbi:hypothetical protein Tther_00410 [Tepidimonas thermarum]|uniref:Transmembrane protein n=1 Tax=Tepidimonas thermarum TaxID=335431 RepID=A0A554X6Y8_9BURK|nr:hypothetical protein [Tepidimonas thermarum]TSE31593.1 hypothetical protein Tther_00410 [Tepidimonas thermarum]